MTITQFQSRLIGLGASARDAELIAASYFAGYWMKTPATKLTNEQREAMETLIADRREEDEEQARITHSNMLRRESAGYLVRWESL